VRRLLVPVALLLAAACSLPLPSGVRAPSNVASQRQSADLQVLPQGPTAGQGSLAVVAGFLAAQASPAGDYAIAREFLTGDAARRWSPHLGVRVYRPESEQIQPPARDQPVPVLMTEVGEVDSSGRYVAHEAPKHDFYGVIKIREGWRINSLPTWVGLQLTQVDLLRTFAARNIYYLAPRHAGDPRHLVPDRVFLPGGPKVGADALVRRLFEQPTAALGDSVDPIDPSLALLSVRRSRDGVVTVTLSDDALSLGTDDLRDLCARLVWTLRADPAFTGLRLSTSRGVLRPPGVPDVQPATAWESYDPESLDASPAYLFVKDRRIAASGTRLTASPLTTGSRRVDQVAVSPRGDRLAALVANGATVEVDLGSTRSSRVSTVAQASGLTSPTWGSGERGLWMVQHDGRPGHSDRVVRVEPTGSTLLGVPIASRPAGRISSLALSRDGARAALVIGRAVYVFRVTWTGETASLVEPRLLPTGHRGIATQVVWSTPTELVVLKPDQGALAVQRVAVDGSASTYVLLGTLSPTSLAAAGSTLVVASGGQLWSVAQGITSAQPVGMSPAFPG
jgi:hypothetical protein